MRETARTQRSQSNIHVLPFTECRLCPVQHIQPPSKEVVCQKLGGLPGPNAEQWSASTTTTSLSPQEECVQLLPVVTGPQVSPVFEHMGEKVATAIPILLRWK